MRVVKNDITAAEWNALIAPFDPPLNHSGVWGELERVLTGEEPHYLTVLDDAGNVIGIALAFWKRPSDSPAMRWMKLLVAESMPIANVKSEQEWHSLLTALEGYAHDNGGVGIEFGPYQSNCPRSAAETCDYDVRTYYEFPIDITPDEDVLWANLSTERKRNIKKAQKAELSIEEGTSRDDLLILDTLQSQTKQRAAERGDDFPGYQSAYLEAHESVLLGGDSASLFIARRNNEPVSAALITHFNKRAYYFFGGTSKDGYKCGASPFVLWQALLAAKERGFVEFNLGGVRGDMRDKDSAFFGLYRFKRGYGADELASYDAKKTLRALHSKVFYGTKKVAKLLHQT